MAPRGAVIPILLGLQLAAAATTDSVYSSETLRELVAEASRFNREVPRSLAGYHAVLESEISLVLHRSDGVETTGQIEQMHGEATWRRSGAYEQHVTGYRLQAAGPSLSALTYLHQAWTVPVLYGNRLALFFGPDSARETRRRERRRDSLLVVHPFALDRDGWYRFSGGDTIVKLRIRGRTIPIVRVLVHPRTDREAPALLFDGEVDVDAVQKHVVRLRGFFTRVGARRGILERIADASLTGVAFVELVNEEVAERYWLPSYQRVEVEAASVVTGDNRSIIRIISRFHDFTVAAADTDTAVVAAAGDTLRALPHRLTLAPRDSLEAYASWDASPGVLSRDARAEDFDDVAPDVWRPTGPPSLTMRPRRFADLFRFNRVEGAFTGYAVDLRMRDAAPGLTFSGAGGWAWAERTWRGDAGVSWTHSSWRLGLTTSRSLASTNDFTYSFDIGATMPALFGFGDDYDYLDRRATTLSMERSVERFGGLTVTVQGGPASDRVVTSHVTHGLWRGDSAFRTVRGIAPGRYGRFAAQVAWHAIVYRDVIRSGVGGQLRYERGVGDLAWQRVEGEFVLRRWLGPLTFTSRVNAGLVAGYVIPPQQLFEVGSTQELSGFGYKEFGGDRALVARAALVRPLALWRAPLHVGTVVLPGPWPAIGVGMHAGWADAATAAARRSLYGLGTRPDFPSGGAVPLSVPAGHVRSVVDARVQLFGGAIRLGLARPLEHDSHWSFALGFGQEF